MKKGVNSMTKVKADQKVQDYIYMSCVCGEREMSYAQVARALGKSPQNLNNKLHRGTISAAEFIQIADICGYDVRLIERSTDRII